LDRYWFANTPPERIATLRLLIGTYTLVYLLIRSPFLMSYAQMPAVQFQPVGVVSLLAGPLPAWLVRTLVLLTIPLSAAFVLGFRHQILAPVFAVVLLWVLTYSNSFGQILHTDNMLMLHVLVLALSPAAHAYSLDRRSGEPKEPGTGCGWPIRLMCLVCVTAYCLAGVAKLRNGGMDFFDGDTLRNHIAFDNVRKLELGSVHSPLGAMVLPWSWFFAPMAWLTLTLELGAPLALLHRRLGQGWAIAMWAFHLGVLALMAVGFIYPLSGLAFAPFFPVERLGEWAKNRWYRSKTMQ
jgi:hypothetical protein